MEDYEEQELEFWRKLEEMDMSRSSMLKRSVAAVAGLTVLSTPEIAMAARGIAAVNPPLKGKSVPLKEIVAEAKKEGKLNVIALPHDWANYGEMITTFKKKYGLSMDEQNPDGTSAQENQAVSSLKGDSARAGRRRRRPAVRDLRHAAGPVREVLQYELRRRSRAP